MRSNAPCRSWGRMLKFLLLCSDGEVREWTNRHAWKACVSATGPWVRIPPSPPYEQQSWRVMCVKTKAIAVETAKRGWDSNRVVKGICPLHGERTRGLAPSVSTQ